MHKDDKLQILKDILLTDERTYALKIEEKLKVLEDTLNKKNQLSEKVDPIIEEKLNQFIAEIPETLGPTITEALKTEIANSQDAVVEALFPIMGKMIKKYVQNEMQKLSESINAKLSNTFSFKSFRKKAKATFTGVTEADLILADEFKPVIDQILVIENHSGILKAEYSLTKNIDEDMVSGMLTAIKSFAEDAFTNEKQELNYIQYDTFHIHIQNFSNYYIAVVVSGAYHTEFKSKLEDKLLDFAIHKINKTDLTETINLQRKLQDYFTNENL
jgi:hypothetical protein